MSIDQPEVLADQWYNSDASSGAPSERQEKYKGFWGAQGGHEAIVPAEREAPDFNRSQASILKKKIIVRLTLRTVCLRKFGWEFIHSSRGTNRRAGK